MCNGTETIGRNSSTRINSKILKSVAEVDNAAGVMALYSCSFEVFSAVVDGIRMLDSTEMKACFPRLHMIYKKELNSTDKLIFDNLLFGALSGGTDTPLQSANCCLEVLGMATEPTTLSDPEVYRCSSSHYEESH